MPSAYPGASAAPKRRWSGLSALLAGVLTALLVVTGFNAAPAMAANGTVDIEFTDGTTVYKETPVFEAGQTYGLRIVYAQKDGLDGKTFTIKAPQGFTLSEGLFENEALSSFEVVDGEMRFTFVDPLTIVDGFIEAQFTVDTVETSSEQDVSWLVNGEDRSETIIIKKPGDSFADITAGVGKDGTGAQWPAIQVSDDGKVSLGEEFLGTEINFAAWVDSDKARKIELVDTLEDGLTLVPGSFVMDKTTWDANGLNKTVHAAEPVSPELTDNGAGFTYSFDAEANSQYKLRYTAKITDQASLTAIEALLQAAYDATGGEEGAGYGLNLMNSVTFNGEKREAGVWLGGNIPHEDKPGLGTAFGKQSQLTPGPGQEKDAAIELVPGSTKLVTPIPVQYTLTADLTQFAPFAENPKWALTRNVVITDELPAQLQWIVADVDAAMAEQGFTKVDALSDEDFLAAAQSYMITGNTLKINVGQDTAKNFAFKLNAQLVDVEGLTKNKVGNNDNPYAEFAFSEIKNAATFVAYSDGRGHTAKTTDRVVTLKDPSEGIDDQAKFSKRATKGEIVLESGNTVDVPFRFTVAAGIGDAKKSTITDFIDHSALNVTEDTLAKITQSVTGEYTADGKTSKLGPDAFTVTIVDGNLVFEPKGGASWGQAEDVELKGAFWFEASIPSQPVDGNLALKIENKASLTGTDREIKFDSETHTRAGAKGSELQASKSVYVPAKDGEGSGRFKSSVRAEIGANGKLVQDEYVYRVRLQPKMSYTKLLSEISDKLVDNVEFLGFVEPQDLKSGKTVAGNAFQIPGTKVNVSYNPDTKTITIPKGQEIVGGENTDLLFKVRIAEFTEGVPVMNAVGSAQATITPTNDLPIDISKINEKNPLGPPITDIVDGKLSADRSSFKLVDEAGKTVLEDLYVVDGKLRMAGENGAHLTPSVKKSGTYMLHEVYAPKGFVLNTEPIKIVVGEDGTETETKVLNTPTSVPGKVSVGDYVWFDADGDGIQGTSPDEKPIPGVKLVLTGPDGKPVIGHEGREVKPTVTDANGNYSFTDLPILKDGESYTVSIDQTDEGTIEALGDWIPTKPGVGERDKDSSDWSAASEGLTQDGDKDLTLDFGFQPRSYAIGDVVWVDQNRDGQQGEDEFLEGVTVTLFSVATDDEGAETLTEVAVTATDANGRYLFDRLPAGNYQVKFTLTDEQQAKYVFTQLNAGEADADSDADPKTGQTVTIVLDGSNTNLTSDYVTASGEPVQATEGIDPTWDAGVILKTYAIGDVVWVDDNADGVQGEDEFLEGVTVTLYSVTTDENGELVREKVADTTTDANGRYLFDELRAGTYEVQFELTDEQQTKYIFTKLNAGETGTDSDANPKTGFTTQIVLDDSNVNLTHDYETAAGEPVKATQGIDPTWDAGVIYKTFAIGDVVWVDDNADGVQGEDEFLEGVTVTLYSVTTDENGELVREKVADTTTDANGRYLFDELRAGTYEVQFELTDEQQTKYIFTKLNAGETGTDSDANPKTGFTTQIVLDDSNVNLTHDYVTATGEAVKATQGIDPTWDAGVIHKTYAIGDVVWIDTNKDGLQGESEYTLKDVIVRLFDEQGNLVAETTTDKNGLYVFDELRAGKYRVQFELTPAQAKVYSFTKTGGGDTALDSDAGKDGFSRWIVLDDSNAELTLDYPYADLVGGIKATQGIDPTWDAGVIVKKVIDEGPGPEGPGPKDPGTDNPGKPGKQDPTGTPNQPKGSVTLGGLAVTGGSFGWAYAAGGAALLVLGAGALLLARRRSGAHA